jgi:hypothetical protein
MAIKPVSDNRPIPGLQDLMIDPLNFTDYERVGRLWLRKSAYGQIMQRSESR